MKGKGPRSPQLPANGTWGELGGTMGPLFDSFDPWNVFLTWNAKRQSVVSGDERIPPQVRPVSKSQLHYPGAGSISIPILCGDQRPLEPRVRGWA